MRDLIALLARFRSDRTGSTAIEYGLIAAGIGATIAVVAFNLGGVVLTDYYEFLADLIGKAAEGEAGS